MLKVAAQLIEIGLFLNGILIELIMNVTVGSVCNVGNDNQSGMKDKSGEDNSGNVVHHENERQNDPNQQGKCRSSRV